MAQNTQVLPSKEASLFRHLVQNYETKQYKKGLKAAEQILRKHPNHGDTQAMKALILSNQNKSDEAFELCKLALKNAMKSHVCWHVYGLLYRQQKNYEEAIKAYRFALRLDPDSQQIQRDLALLQMQMRDYTGYVQSRRQMLQAKPGFRQNWTALAVALHLSGDLAGAEDVLQRYEESMRNTPTRSDLEHAEAVLYKNTIIAEEGDLTRALEHLEGVKKNALDRTAVMEMRADYLLRLDRKEDAEKAYRILLKRNPHHAAYYEGLEKALGLQRGNKEDQEKLGQMYHSCAEQSDRIDAARRIPLDFKEGDAFQQHADKYLRRMFKKGIPSTFANLKQLYADPAKKDSIRSLVESYLNEESQVSDGAEQNPTDEQVNGTAAADYKPAKIDPATTWQLSINYFLAQHYDYHLSRDLSKAESFIDKTIALNPSKSDYTYTMTRARILKHAGNVQKASQTMNEAREMDPKDRYINTKCAKYQLRADLNSDAIDTMGLFTRNEAVGGPLGDLMDMQCVWYITEDGESYHRQGKLALALKRFKAVFDIFETWVDDQFDFHTFSLRKGMVRAYVDMVRWEDKLREHPFFTRAALSAIRIYLLLHDRPELASKGAGIHGHGDGAESAAEKKKAAKKAKRDAEKAEADRKAAAAKKAQPPKGGDEDEKKKEDADPQGLEAFKVAAAKPLEEAMKWVQPLLELSPKNLDGQAAGFEIYMRRKKYLPALKCLLAIRSLAPEHPLCHEQTCRLRLALEKAAEPLPEAVKKIVDETFLSTLDSAQSVEACNEAYLSRHQDSALHVRAVVKVRAALHPEAEEARAKSARDLQATLTSEGTSVRDAEEGLRVLEELGVGKEAREGYVKAAMGRWSGATVFQVR